MNKKIIYGIIGSVVLVAIILLSRSSSKEVQQSNQGNTVQQSPEETYEIQGQEHIDIGASHIEYNSNPPTSGPHYVQPANWGFYNDELPDEQLVHNLEHGGIWISYKNVDEETLSEMKKLARGFPGSVVITPRAKNEQNIILASWGKIQRLNEYDRVTIINFVKNNKNKSPEPIAQ